MVLNRQVVWFGIGLVLLLVFFPHLLDPFANFIIFGCATYITYYLFNKKTKMWLVGAGFAVLHNPIIPYYLPSRPVLATLFVLTAAFFFLVLYLDNADGL